MKRINLIFIFIFIILLSGCHSFYRIDTNELRGISNKDLVQIKFVDGKKLNISNVQHANITENQELEIIKYSFSKYKIDPVRTIYPLNDIKEIRVEKFDVQKSIFASMWITIGAVSLFLLFFCSNGCSVGG
ncbi:MAG: hypothetical protein PF445_07620 [Melioribacteraceae bacterium]|jgi:hypothetical protein|nr:hypothetical protein [Melioribacteraceae bacterium]